jgi:hypothetical protein
LRYGDLQYRIGKFAAVTTVVLSDILELVWADIVYFSSVCYSESLLDYISQTSDRLKPVTRVVSLKNLHLSSKFAEVAIIMGYNDAFVYLKHS